MEVVLDSIKPVIQNSRHVRINQEAIATFAQSVKEEDFKKAEFSKETVLTSGSEEDYIASVMVYCALNFCYWGDPKWAVNIDGQDYDGSAAMVRCIKRAVERGYPLLDSAYLSSIPVQDLQGILAGNVQIPLFNERAMLLRKLGNVVTRDFGGSFASILDWGRYDALEVTATLVDNIPTVFNDVTDYHGHTVAFYKRAQLVPGYVNNLHELGLVSRPVSGMDQLTAFSDYKVPQHLRQAKILEYSPTLAHKVDNKIEIPQGSDEETEIRANTVHSINLTHQALKPRFPGITPGEVDGIFWFRGQVKLPDDKPYHRTLTLWY